MKMKRRSTRGTVNTTKVQINTWRVPLILTNNQRRMTKIKINSIYSNSLKWTNRTTLKSWTLSLRKSSLPVRSRLSSFRLTREAKFLNLRSLSRMAAVSESKMTQRINNKIKLEFSLSSHLRASMIPQSERMNGKIRLWTRSGMRHLT